ncbi:amidohydrolase family protein [Bordetella sp. 2513F-2]
MAGCAPAPGDEIPIDPDLPVVDAHHHLYVRPGLTYLLDDYLRDLHSGHRVVATVYVQARSMPYTDGPEALRPVGETVFANGVAREALQRGHDGPRVCAGIVGHADLLLGSRVSPVLEAHVEAGTAPEGGGNRFKGVRHIAAWDESAELLNPAYPTTEGMLDSPAFRAGFAQLGALGLSFDAWVLFHQLPRLARLARAFPAVPIALNHCGGVVGIGRYARIRDQVFQAWKAGIEDLASCPNVMVKLGGLGMPLSGFGFDTRKQAASSAALASAWRPWVETCVEAFGSRRCMIESNFPPDKASYRYATGLNAMKRILRQASDDEKADIFRRNAARFYRLPEFAM